MRVARRSRRKSLGQTLVIFAFTGVVLFGVLGLAVDAGADYFVSAQTERAASNAALAGVPYMQGTLATYQAAASQAFAIAEENDFGTSSFTETAQASSYPFPPELFCNPSATACGGAGCTLTDRTCGSSVLVQCVPVVPATSPPSCAGNKLEVTVTTVNGNFFGGLLGIGATKVSRTSTSEYLPPLQLGQPGGSIGSDTTTLGTGNNQYFMRLEAWGSDRGNGDAYTPNWSDGSDSTTDEHVLSSDEGNEASTPTTTLASYAEDPRGGYNYLVYVPAGQSGHIQMFNPAFGPDNGYAPGGTANYHEQDSYTTSLTSPNNYPLMDYTIYKVNNIFDYKLDTELSQASYESVIPMANSTTAWTSGGTPAGYDIVSTSGTFTYHAGALPGFYHGWEDVGIKDTSGSDGSYNQFASTSAYAASYSGGVFTGGASGTYYRVRVDAQKYDGSDANNSGASAAHKGFAGRIVINDGSSTACTNCTFGAINDFAIYTPIDGPAHPSGFSISLMQVPPEYAGKTVTLSLFDPGDMNGCPSGPFNTIKILQPNNAVAALVKPSQATSSAASDVLDVGPDLKSYFSNPGGVTVSQALLPSGFTSNQAAFGTINASGSNIYNGHWLTMQVQVPANYSSIINLADPTTWYWSMNYTTNCDGNDTVTVNLSYGGSPVHLIP